MFGSFLANLPYFGGKILFKKIQPFQAQNHMDPQNHPKLYDKN